MNKVYSIEFNSYWHIGSGLSGGVEADSLVLKDNDKEGLPYIPGKTLKGLIREAAEVLKELKVLNDDFITELFGRKTEGESQAELDSREPGKLFFSNAYLSESLQEEIIKKKTSHLLYEKIAANKIDEKTGTSVKNSLREIEVCIPLTLYAKILDIPEKTDITSLENCLKMVKRMGLNRNRGLGQCKLKFIEEDKNEN